MQGLPLGFRKRSSEAHSQVDQRLVPATAVSLQFMSCIHSVPTRQHFVFLGALRTAKTTTLIPVTVGTLETLNPKH